jgi:hypothetical protein
VPLPGLTYLQRLFTGDRANMLPGHGPFTIRNLVPTWQAKYDLLEIYYNNNAVYEAINRLNFERAKRSGKAIKAIHNPYFRAVEFYPGKLWPGTLPDALPISTENQDIIKPINQIWEWSNWSNKKQLAARQIAEYGDLFIKVAQVPKSETSSGRVYFDLIKPRTVTDLDTDERGFVTYIRLDIPLEWREGDKVRKYTHTEVWSKALGTYRAWDHEHGEGYELDRLGRPDDTVELAEIGIDFVPFVYSPFRDIGEQRGASVCEQQLDKIDEINAKVTRLAELMFRYNRPIWAILSNMIDATRRAMPAPRIDDGIPEATGITGSAQTETWLSGEPVLYFPGLSEPKLMIPDIHWDWYDKVIDSDNTDLEYDCPELAYYRIIREYKSDSGRALWYALSPVIDRAREVRANVETALARANQMGLTIAIAAGHFPSSIGKFGVSDRKRSLDHSFVKRPLIPLSDLDIAETDRTKSEALERKHNLDVPLERIWRELGYDQNEIAENKKWLKQEQQEKLDHQIESMQAVAAAQPAPQAPGDTPGQAPADTVPGQGKAPITSRSGQPPGRPARGVQSRNDPNLSRR